MNNLQKIVIGTAAMLVWGGLVVWGKTDVSQYVDALKQILTAVGVYHLAFTNPKG